MLLLIKVQIEQYKLKIQEFLKMIGPIEQYE